MHVYYFTNITVYVMLHSYCYIYYTAKCMWGADCQTYMCF